MNPKLAKDRKKPIASPADPKHKATFTLEAGRTLRNCTDAEEGHGDITGIMSQVCQLQTETRYGYPEPVILSELTKASENWFMPSRKSSAPPAEPPPRLRTNFRAVGL